MRRYFGCMIGLLVCAACSEHAPFSADGPTAPSSVVTPTAATPTAASAPVPENFRAHLNGDQVVPLLPVQTLAQGQVTFQLSPDGTELSYQVIVSNIENVTGAHIHLGAVGGRGARVALLMTPVPPNGGRFSGVLTRGTLTAADL